MLRTLFILPILGAILSVASCAQSGGIRPVITDDGTSGIGSQLTVSTDSFGPIKGVRSGAYTVDKTHAFLTASLSHWGLSTYKMQFSDFDATLDFDAQNPEASNITLTLNPASLETFYPTGDKRDAWHDKLKFGKKFLDANTHPKAVFTSTGITRQTPNSGAVTGNLQFMGITRPVTAQVKFNGARAFPWAPLTKHIGLDATLIFKRSEFGLTNLVPNIGDEVTIEFTGEFKPAR